MNKPHRILALLGALCFAAGSVGAEPKPSPVAQRLLKHRDAERYRVSAAGTSVQAGAARVAVAAPIEVVRDVVTDFGDYATHIKKFKKSHVVGRKGKKTDVYMQVPILKGLGKVWAIVRFAPAKTEGGQEVIVGKMLKGNVKRLDATLRLERIDDDNTQLNLELLIIPDMPVPGSLITGEVEYAADEAVTGLRDWSESLKHKK